MNFIKRIFYLMVIAISLLWGIFIFYACREEVFDNIPVEQKIQSFSTIERMKVYLNEQLQNMSLPNMAKNNRDDGSKQTRSDIRLRYNPDEFTIHWDSIQVYRERNYTTYIYAISPTKPLFGFAHTSLETENRATLYTAYFKLAIRIAIDTIYSSVFTYMPEYKYLRKKGNKISMLGWDLDGTSYSGIFLVSDLDGTFHFGKKYDNGVLKMYFFPYKSHTTTHSTLQNLGIEEDINVCLDLFDASKADVQGMSYYAFEPGGSSNNGGSTGGNLGGGSYKCSRCGKSVDACNCNLGITVCRICGKSIDKCTCYTVACSLCKKNPCVCGKGETGGTDNGSSGGGSGSGSSGGNSGGGNMGSSAATKAKKIFWNTVMSETEWMEIERMIDEIVNDCMGKALYDGLVEVLKDKRLGVAIDPSKAGYFGMHNGYAVISLNRKEESHLFHEMFHAYQSYQEADIRLYNSSLLNREIETHYAQYIFTRRQPDYEKNGKFLPYNLFIRYKAIKKLEKYMDHKGYILSDSSLVLKKYIEETLIPTFRKVGYSEDGYPYDFNRKIEENFKNIVSLSKDC